MPIHLASDGVLVGLLHLTAVASASDGMIIAIEEMENQLHPFAIRTILAAIRERADAENLTVLLTTHSPVLMNEFRDTPEDFLVFEPGPSPSVHRLSEIRDPDWLAHFQLGDLYDRGEFGRPGKVS